MLQAEYWISELADLSGVSTRTIRYYMAEGLLPQPELRGKYAIFTEGYLHRLRLIKLLKDTYLPLREIKSLLDSLSDSEMISLLHEFEQDPAGAMAGLQGKGIFSKPASQMREINNSALDYISNLRVNPKTETSAALPDKKEYRTRAEPSLTAQPPLGAPNLQKVRKAEEWQRVELAPGLELHIRQPVRPHLRRLIDRLTEMINKEIQN